jgi:hypothetical protein
VLGKENSVRVDSRKRKRKTHHVQNRAAVDVETHDKLLTRLSLLTDIALRHFLDPELPSPNKRLLRPTKTRSVIPLCRSAAPVERLTRPVALFDVGEGSNVGELKWIGRKKSRGDYAGQEK